jgi:hypothetical protein
MNYQALGEYTAFKQEALSAVDRRNTWVNNLERDLRRMNLDDNMDADRLRARVNEIEKAQNDLTTALARANAAANECGKPVLNVALLSR